MFENYSSTIELYSSLYIIQGIYNSGIYAKFLILHIQMGLSFPLKSHFQMKKETGAEHILKREEERISEQVMVIEDKLLSKQCQHILVRYLLQLSGKHLMVHTV